MLKKVLSVVAEEVFGDVLEKKKEQLSDAVKNVVNDKIESFITGKRTIDEWAEIAIQGVDKIKYQKVHEEDLRFVDGRLHFEISHNNPQNVIISFKLYFLDDFDEWKKVEGHSDVLISNFTDEAIEEMKTKGNVEFGVEG